jgi:hypothetical protein
MQLQPWHLADKRMWECEEQHGFQRNSRGGPYSNISYRWAGRLVGTVNANPFRKKHEEKTKVAFASSSSHFRKKKRLHIAV